MNKQKTAKGNGIEWTDYTWNPIAGCQHGCRWVMPDGSEALCYAETVAERVAQSAYPQGFSAHYWKPEKLAEPARVKTPSKIFMDSMSDLMGAWVSARQILEVLGVVRDNPQHTFQLLTKNAPRLLEFDKIIRALPNLWVGVSVPPSKMFGKMLSHNQQVRMINKQLIVLRELDAAVSWMSIEPLSFDVEPHIRGAGLDWIVIGAASNGRKTVQPEAQWVGNLLRMAKESGTAVFFKGNLRWLKRREEFPSLTARGNSHTS